MIKKNLFLLSILPLLFSCSNKECECIDKALKTKLPTEYKNKVNRATFNYLGMYYSNGETEYLDSAIMILNQAIEISHTLFPAYYFKSIVYEAKGDYGSIIITVDSAIKYSYTDPNMLFFKARALDHLGMAEEADNVLESAERLYSQWIYCYPDSISFIISRIGFTAYYKGKTVAIKEINNYIKEYPNDDIIVGLKNMIENEPEDSELFRKKNELMNQL
jgi:tetratricopeptide (TPR) repeat protein